MSDNTNTKLQIQNSIQLIKLRRIQELNSRLTETLKRERIPASKASELYVSILEELRF